MNTTALDTTPPQKAKRKTTTNAQAKALRDQLDAASAQARRWRAWALWFSWPLAFVVGAVVDAAIRAMQ